MWTLFDILDRSLLKLLPWGVCNEVSRKQYPSYYFGQSQQMKQSNEPIRTRSIYTYLARARKSACEEVARLVLFLLFIGWEKGESFSSQSGSVTYPRYLQNHGSAKKVTHNEAISRQPLVWLPRQFLCFYFLYRKDNPWRYSSIWMNPRIGSNSWGIKWLKQKTGSKEKQKKKKKKTTRVSLVGHKLL